MADTMELRIADRQMNGIYSTLGYRRLVASVSSLKSDLARTHELERRSKRPGLAFDGESMTLALMQDAYDGVTASIAALVAEPLDTTDPKQWLYLRDAVIGIARLSVIPDFDGRQGLSVHVLTRAVASMMDVMFRLADRAQQADAVPTGDEREDRVRIATIYMDLCVGRAAAWLSCIDDLGCEACALAGGNNWVTARDAFAAQRSERAVNLLGSVTELAGAGRDAVGKAWVTTMIEVALLYDAWQFAGMRAATGATSADLDVDLVRESLDRESFLAIVEGGESPLALPDEDGSDMRGWCRTFQVHPLACCFNLTYGVERSMRPGFDRMRTLSLSKKAAEAMAAAGIHDDDLVG